jgi:hypothetical protein
MPTGGSLEGLLIAEIEEPKKLFQAEACSGGKKRALGRALVFPPPTNPFSDRPLRQLSSHPPRARSLLRDCFRAPDGSLEEFGPAVEYGFGVPCNEISGYGRTISIAYPRSRRRGMAKAALQWP